MSTPPRQDGLAFVYRYLRWLTAAPEFRALSALEQKVIIVYLRHADADGVAFPGPTKFPMDRRRLCRARAALKAKGLLVPAKTSNGRAPTHWKLVERSSTMAQTTTVKSATVDEANHGQIDHTNHGQIDHTNRGQIDHPKDPVNSQITAQQQQTAAAAASSAQENGRDLLVTKYGAPTVLAAEAEIQRRAKAGIRITNPAGLLRTMLRDGFTPATPTITLASPEQIAEETAKAAAERAKQEAREAERTRRGLEDLHRQRQIAAEQRRKREAAKDVPPVPPAPTITLPPVDLPGLKARFDAALSGNEAPKGGA